MSCWSNVRKTSEVNIAPGICFTQKFFRIYIYFSPMFICCMSFLAVVIGSYEHCFQFKHRQRMIIVCDKAKEVRVRGGARRGVRGCVCVVGGAVIMTNAGCMMRKSAAKTTKILSGAYFLFRGRTCLCVFVSVCVWACGASLVYTTVPRRYVCLTYCSGVFRRHVILCFMAPGKPPLQSCPSGSPDWISKHELKRPPPRCSLRCRGSAGYHANAEGPCLHKQPSSPEHDGTAAWAEASTFLHGTLCGIINQKQIKAV